MSKQKASSALTGAGKKNRVREGAARILFLAAACVSILAVLLITVFLLVNGFPAMAKIGIFKFLLGTTWRPGNDIYGILPMILGSIYVTAGALVLGVPIGILTAAFLSRFASRRMVKLLKPAVQLLAGIPSVVYGFFGLVVVVPLTTGRGSMLAACIILGIMILPTIISVSESSLNAVESSYYEGALALGATHEHAVFSVVLPAAKSGVLAGVILGVGRAIGEAMAVIMVAGNQPRMPQGLLKGLRTLTTNIVMEMGYSADLHREALIATAVVLFVFILLINLLFSLTKRRKKS
ncbi:MAG: phosphate ABC transporter permease subunit PstC [Clostridiaceae bacterium]|nr:phosphate ABC transporter permease subunit PstC [Feifaniaceae bacterium]